MSLWSDMVGALFSPYLISLSVRPCMRVCVVALLQHNALQVNNHFLLHYLNEKDGQKIQTNSN